MTPPLCALEKTGRPKEGASSFSTPSLIFLYPLGAMYAWVEGVLIRPHVQIIQPPVHDFCLPKHLAAQPAEGEELAPLSLFLSKGLLGGNREAS